jgi:CRP/FNR family cyclic AMP-dependent transcriptional regulator
MKNEIKKFSNGERILTKGEKSVCAYMIISGEVRVFLEEGSKSVQLARLHENEIFGESAIFGDGENGASVEASADCELLPITRASLNEMLNETDPIIQSLIQMLIKRLRATNEALLKSETREFMDIVLI